MGKKERLRKALREEERQLRRQVIKERGREQFWDRAIPITKKFIALMAIIGLLLGGKMIIDRLPPIQSKPQKVLKSATIVTNKGNIEITFYKNDAPRTVENFVLLAARNYYNGTKWHRVEPGFVIQGGDPLSKDNDPNNDGQGGESAWGGKFADELNADTSSYKKGYVEGTVAMANSGEDTNGSQFFIVLANQPELPKKYTIFGKVKSGMDVVKSIVKGDEIKQIIIHEQKS